MPVKIARVALDVPRKPPFDFWIPEDIPVVVGALVRVPFGAGNHERIGVVVAIESLAAVPTDRLKPLLGRVPGDVAVPPAIMGLAHFAAEYYRCGIGEMLFSALPPGLKRRNPVIEPRPLAYRWTGLAPPSTRSRHQQELHQLLQAGPQSAAAVRHQLPEASATLRALISKGVIAEAPIEAAPVVAVPPLLNDQQQQAAAQISASEGFQVHVLHGVTGSGKTEVYLHCIAAVIARGQQALVLVPEIHLTPQLADIVRARFGQDRVAVAHSSKSEGARSRAWLDGADGNVDIVLGTRLAVFAPLARIGLIVIDEEHDPSFKQAESPRYSARDLAIVRARQDNVPVVLGSATPSLESYENARRGRYQRHILAKRAVVAAQPPKIQLIDTRRARLVEGLAETAIDALKRCVARGEQALVFINRRGYAPALSCFNCGWVAECPRCDAKTVFHRATMQMVCHQCGRQEALPRQCPACGNVDIKPVGRGTQRLESSLTDLLPGARLLRMDRDSMARREAFANARDQIRRGEVDVLVGTQMLAKGHDYPRLTCVVVVDADRSLHANDFRAPERMFAMLLQVAGRAGRAELPGEVWIQTDFPRHPVYATVVSQDFERFARHELAQREQHLLPPAASLIMLRAESAAPEGAIGFLAAIAQTAASFTKAEQLGVQVFDAVPSLITRKADVYRAQLLLSARSRQALRLTLDALEQDLGRPPKGVQWWVDVDPLDI
jgi:primosomal protein N' (replication factor Y) (superfamily II helicase)